LEENEIPFFPSQGFDFTQNRQRNLWKYLEKKAANLEMFGMDLEKLGGSVIASKAGRMLCIRLGKQSRLGDCGAGFVWIASLSLAMADSAVRPGTESPCVKAAPRERLPPPGLDVGRALRYQRVRKPMEHVQP
jgi:hypothetical protein